MAGVIAALGGGAGIAAILVAFGSVIGLMRHSHNANAHGGTDVQGMPEESERTPSLGE